MNTYLIKKIHTLEDRVQARLEKEQSYIKQLIKQSEGQIEQLTSLARNDTVKVEQMIKEKELKSEK